MSTEIVFRGTLRRMDEDLKRVCDEIDALPYTHTSSVGRAVRFPRGVAPVDEILARVLEIPPALAPFVAVWGDDV